MLDGTASLEMDLATQGETMACLGVHFALSDADAATLLSKTDDNSRLAYVQEELEERYFQEPRNYIAESDKAWDATHRALADGQLTYDGGAYPLSHVVLGGRPLYGQDDYIISLKLPAQVKEVADAIAGITQEDFRKRYYAIDPEQYGTELTEEDFQYTWEWFEGVPTLYRRATAENRYVMFTVDQ